MKKVSERRFTPSRPRSARPRDDRLKNLAIEQLCQAIPTGAIALDAHCAAIFSNREALSLLVRWNAVSPKDLAVGITVSPHIPAEVVAACHKLRLGVLKNSGEKRRARFGGRLFVRHPKNPNLSAVVALERSARDRRVAIFCVLLQDRLKNSSESGQKDLLAMLTFAERRVAKLVAEGLRNRDIAAALGKSVTTVKSQLGTIFDKLDVRSRTQLAARLRAV